MQLILWRKQKLSSIIAICVVILAVLICIRLSVWQYQRGEQKQQQLSQLAVSKEQGVLSWQELLNLPSELNKTGLQVKVTGEVNKQHY